MQNADNYNLTVDYPGTRGRGGRGVPAWRRHMAAIQRKTLILCSACHHKLHAGQFDDNFGRRS